jgi:hypothetical protein
MSMMMGGDLKSDVVIGGYDFCRLRATVRGPCHSAEC